MNILEQIVAKRRRTFKLYDFPKRTLPIVPFFSTKPFIIAEFKKASPTNKKISSRPHADLARDYYKAGVRNFSVLTEQNYFQGSLQDLYELKKQYPQCAFLRKDFLFCREDLAQAYLAGADAVLLIAEILSDKLLCELIREAHRLELQVLGEVYSLESLQRIITLPEQPDAIGINSRDLKTFKLRPDQPLRLRPYIPKNIPAVYESGVKDTYLMRLIGNAGFNAVLIGETAVGRPQLLRDFQKAFLHGVKQKANFFTKLYARQKKVFVKICGLTNKADVALAAKSGADVAGFVLLPESPRCVTAKLLRDVKDIKILKVAVVKNITLKVKLLLKSGLIDAVQTYAGDIYSLHGNAYRVTTDFQTRELPVTLYDAPKTKDMKKGKQITAKAYPLIYGQWLAGGLDPQNVRKLLKQIEPGLIDVSSGVESSVEKKDKQKLKEFLQEVRRA
ncbi:indole-3-glycerol phosphate synthase [Candidatus Termititenax dinenymphae]|uniref:N-(5'-phosphoribosyl)anthranilate isomerase n=1 Tax=Candidatus Termititenax dinenymphae TaxID=2218523 RepID=A0A388TJ91_9BACT|nr:indole-3-glycerol phosphate synthase [Candidatus Termititenax dinenymphae]